MGLLDNIMANPEANMALAAGLLQGNFGGGMMGFNQTIAGQRKEKLAQDEMNLKKSLYDAQIQNYQSEAKARELKAAQAAQQQALIARLMGGGDAPSGPSAPVAGDAFMPGAPLAPPQQQPNLMDIAKELGIPPQALQADITFNGGKKISEFLESRSKPKWENINGNLINTADPKFKGGFQSGFSTSSDGRTTAWQPNGNGGLVFGAPQGALETYKAYQNTGEAAKANYDPQTVTTKDGNTTMTTRGKVVDSVNGAGYNGGNRDAANAETLRIMQLELNDPNKSPADKAAILREMGRIRMQSPSAGVPGIPLQSKAEETAAVDTAKANVVRDTAKSADSKRANEMLSNAQRAKELLGEGPTNSRTGAAVDEVLGSFGASTKGADTASKLKALSGWMTANTPRMEGPQSNADVEQYMTMAGRVGDRMLPVSQRMAAVDEVIKLQQKYAHLNGLELKTGDWSDTGKKSSMGGGGWSAKRIN